MTNLIETEMVKTLGRPLGDIKEDKLLAYIREVENTYIKPALGDTLFLALHADDIEIGSTYDLLLNGGEWNDSDAVCGCGSGVHFFSGLRTAIAYFVYAKTLMSADIESTRYGFVQKDGQYSQHVTQAQRTAAYNDAMEVGNTYLRECLEYCRAFELIQTGERRRVAATGGITIRKIG